MSAITPNNFSPVLMTCGDDAESFVNHPVTIALRNFQPVGNLDEDVLNYVVATLTKHIIEHVIFRSPDYHKTLDFVYGLNDGELYTVISAIHEDHYDFFVIHSDYFHPRSANHMHFRETRNSCINFVKNLNRYERQELSEHLKFTGDALQDMKDSLFYTGRRATGLKELQEIVYPSFDKLKLFYECERKVRYASFEEGLKNCEDWNNVFRCEHCNHYHQGRPRQIAPEDVDPAKVLQRYQVTWKRYHSTGRLNEVKLKNNRED